MLARAALVLAAASFLALAAPLAAFEVRVQRTPHDGIQPQLVAADGVLHLVYYLGNEAHGNLFYARSTDSGQTFSPPLRVNQTDDSAIAIGNIRGAHLAVGKAGRPHVAWMGSDKAESGPNGATPMVYTRLADDGQSFEPERNVIQFAAGLDGGGSVAADRAGNVYVAWHAAKPGGRGEQDRTIWVARSDDDGQTFAREQQAWTEPVGACGCCGMRAFADTSGAVYVLYRAAERSNQRDMYLLSSADHGASFRGRLLSKWQIDGCPMSSANFANSPRGTLAAWEGEEDVFAALVGPADAPPAELKLLHPSQKAAKRRHPVIAANDQGEVLLAWVEDMTWKTPGKLKWAVFDAEGKETARSEEEHEVPTWGVVGAAGVGEGFVVLY